MEILKTVFRVEDVSSDPVGGGRVAPLPSLAIQTFAPGNWKKKSRMEKLKTCTPKTGQKITCCCEGQIDPSCISVLCWVVFEQQMGNIYGKHIDAMPSNYYVG